MKKTRRERDFLGAMDIPADAYWGVHTQRALENFPVSGQRSHRGLVRALIEIKLTCAIFFREKGMQERAISRAIERACREALSGAFDSSFPTDRFQAGAGTSLNMNVNEVIANRANELLGGVKGAYAPVHPNDHVNRCQSTNDVVPTAARIALIRAAGPLVDALMYLSRSLAEKGAVFAKLVKSGRTHLTDATPVTLGAEFRAYGLAVAEDARQIGGRIDDLRRVGIGGTATGSGLNAPAAYRRSIAGRLSATTGVRLVRSESLYEAMQNQAAFARYMGAVKAACLNLLRISNDLRLLASGPHTGLNEINLPEVQAGSSIMPGKINPSVLEMLAMVCYHCCGAEETVALAVQAGQLELNVMMPLIANSCLDATDVLAAAVRVADERCVRGIAANREVLRKYAVESLGIVTVLAPRLGYERAAALVKEAKETGRPVIELVRAAGAFTATEIEGLLFASAGR